jgi:hypothetical protein
MLQEGKIGVKANKGVADLRLTDERDLVVAQGHASFQEAVLGGHVFGVANQTGVTSQAGLSVTTPVLTLCNPAGSGKNAVLWYAGATFTVVFAAVAAIFVAVGTNTVDSAVTGTLTTTHRNLKLGASSTNACKVYLAATLPTTPVAVAILGAGLTGAVNLLPNTQPLGRWFNGSIILKPGTNLSLQTSTASGASGMFCEYIWEEIDE